MAAGALFALTLTACSQSRYGQSALDPRGPYARKLADLINPVFVVACIIFVLVEGLVLVFSFKFRRRSAEDAPKQIHGHTALETFWTITPALILATIGIFTVSTLFNLNHRPKGPDVLHVNVTGHQWWWEFNYPDLGVTTANQLHIPANRPVDITLTSVDVIHNFWPAKLAGKIYAIPGRINHMSIEADKPGLYYGQCAEFCGMSHANMRFQVIAQTGADFDSWTTANRTEGGAVTLPNAESNPDAAAGAGLFRQKGCSGCHSIEGYSAGTVGPNLTHLHQRTVFAGSIFELNDNNLRLWLQNPPAAKPGSRMPNLNLSDDEITKLIAYLDTLK